MDSPFEGGRGAARWGRGGSRPCLPCGWWVVFVHLVDGAPAAAVAVVGAGGALEKAGGARAGTWGEGRGEWRRGYFPWGHVLLAEAVGMQGGRRQQALEFAGHHVVVVVVVVRRRLVLPVLGQVRVDREGSTALWLGGVGWGLVWVGRGE